MKAAKKSSMICQVLKEKILHFLLKVFSRIAGGFGTVMDASLANFLSSLLWGAVIVVIPVSAAVFLISQNDRVDRKL